jgi:hypothetical protein
MDTRTLLSPFLSVIASIIACRNVGCFFICTPNLGCIIWLLPSVMT